MRLRVFGHKKLEKKITKKKKKKKKSFWLIERESER